MNIALPKFVIATIKSTIFRLHNLQNDAEFSVLMKENYSKYLSQCDKIYLGLKPTKLI